MGIMGVFFEACICGEDCAGLSRQEDTKKMILSSEHIYSLSRSIHSHCYSGISFILITLHYSVHDHLNHHDYYLAVPPDVTQQLRLADPHRQRIPNIKMFPQWNSGCNPGRIHSNNTAETELHGRMVIRISKL
ncbi:hypothetical protein BDP27DRAFT_1341723 [Rhodocollybia butyracea]|uniref:Uncharacterized protein n=1 Tax=Rhodocollybia butyracea TaxID=206335 RepID=A0A9P5P9H3_9AGAR|nr:hypothetical protein BDP27DRAFT_1341723 [Rhodocollybia butyracea]